MAVGYDQRQKRFIVRNSWGIEWGQQGYFTMPYAYLETLADDFWTIRQQKFQTREWVLSEKSVEDFFVFFYIRVFDLFQ